MKTLLSLLLLFEVSASYAYTIKSSNSADSSYTSSKLSLSRSNPKPDPADWSYWKVSLGRSLTKAQTSADTDLLSTSFNGSADFLLLQDFTLGFAFDSSSTKENGYQSQGPTFHMGYLFSKAEIKPVKKEEIEEDEELQVFSPSFGIDLYVGSSRIKQDFVVTILNQNLNRTAQIEENNVSLDLSWNLLEWLTLGASGQSYNYDKAKEDLQKVKGSPLVNTKAVPLVTTIEGLLKSGSSVSAEFYWGSWTLSVSSSRSVLH